jgi:peptide-methionine (S)-S-oxide reductase
MKTETATLGAGCFWCVEAMYSSLKGVIEVKPGYSGGSTINPTYEEVYTDTTGHAEVVQIQFNPEEISFAKLLEVFWKTHDPTTLNRQGEDIGTRYRSVIFYHSPEQKAIAEDILKKLEAEKIWNNPIVTVIEPFKAFYVAENYHHNYYRQNTQKEYCDLVITPKIEKFRKVFADFLKQ